MIIAAAVMSTLQFIFNMEYQKPVSYTHLDVYKRQGKCRGAKVLSGKHYIRNCEYFLGETPTSFKNAFKKAL